MKEDIAKKIEEEILDKKKIPVEEQKKINVRIYSNLMVAIVIVLYCIFLILGFHNIKRRIFIIDLKVFSIGILAIAILLFETSYRKDDGKLCIYGIEILILAITSLTGIYVCILLPTKFNYLVATVSYIFAIYYTGKAIIIAHKMKKEYRKSLSDISEIVKKEKPVKKEETKKKKEVIKEEKKQEEPKKQENKVTTKKQTNMKKATTKTQEKL